MEDDFLQVLANGVRLSVRLELVQVHTLIRLRLKGKETVQVSLRTGGDIVVAD